MAEQAVNELSTATPNLTDYIIGMSDTAEYRALVSAVAKKIVEDYAGSSLAGSNQSVKAALDSLNSNSVIPVTSNNEYITIDSNASRKIGRHLALISFKAHCSGGTVTQSGNSIIIGANYVAQITAMCGTGGNWTVTGAKYIYFTQVSGIRYARVAMADGEYIHVNIVLPID